MDFNKLKFDSLPDRKTTRPEIPAAKKAVIDRAREKAMSKFERKKKEGAEDDSALDGLPFSRKPTQE